MSIAILFWVYHLNRLPPPSPSQPTTARRQSNNTRASTSSVLLAVVSPSRASKFSGSSSPYILITFLDGVAFFDKFFYEHIMIMNHFVISRISDAVCDSRILSANLSSQCFLYFQGIDVLWI